MHSSNNQNWSQNVRQRSYVSSIIYITGNDAWHIINCDTKKSISFTASVCEIVSKNSMYLRWWSDWVCHCNCQSQYCSPLPRWRCSWWVQSSPRVSSSHSPDPLECCPLSVTSVVQRLEMLTRNLNGHGSNWNMNAEDFFLTCCKACSGTDMHGYWQKFRLLYTLKIMCVTWPGWNCALGCFLSPFCFSCAVYEAAVNNDSSLLLDLSEFL